MWTFDTMQYFKCELVIEICFYLRDVNQNVYVFTRKISDQNHRVMSEDTIKMQSNDRVPVKKKRINESNFPLIAKLEKQKRN